LDIKTLAEIQGILLVLQVLILFIQYAANRTFKELGWWAIGSLFMALGIGFMPMINDPNLIFLAIISNPLFVGGHFLLAYGIVTFVKKNPQRLFWIIFYVVAMLGYYFFLFANPNLSARTIIIHGSLAAITGFTSYHLLIVNNGKPEYIRGFLGTSFLLAGLFFTFRTTMVIFSYPIENYTDQWQMVILSFLLPMIFTTLWTYGLVLMVTQRLSDENIMEKRKLQTVFNTAPDAIIIINYENGLIVDANKGFMELSGYELSEVVGFSDIQLNLWKEQKTRLLIYDQLKTNHCFTNIEARFIKKSGSSFDAIVSCQLSSFDNSQMVVCSIHDITERKLAEDRIKTLNTELEFERNLAHMNSMTDSLTGLANRRMFDETLFEIIVKLKEEDKPLSLIMIDIDLFKAFNDTYGHVTGDYALEELGHLLAHTINQEHFMAARYGGEEFAIILPEMSNQEAMSMAESIRQMVNGMTLFIEETQEETKLTVSMGVITIPSVQLTNSKNVINLADKALYLAKQNGRNRIETLEL